jgi:succinyl-CoA synthetase beta subunit
MGDSMTKLLERADDLFGMRGTTVKIHEYQAKAILGRYGVPVPAGEVAHTPSEVADIARRLGGAVVVKAQIHAGGRGKGGGVKLAKAADEAEQIAAGMIGMNLVTHQTGPEGRIVKRILVEPAARIARELYLGLVIDRATGRPVLMASPAGGMEIEKVAAETPHLIFKAFIDPAVGLLPFQARSLAFSLGLEGGAVSKAAKVMGQIVETFMGTDASLVEINPLIVTDAGDIVALDAKMNFDDNALFRHPDIKELRDFDEEDPLEIEASKYSLNYIRLDGNIGCMVNGAGLAMATMDVIKLAGGEPANFLDVGGGATADQIRNAVRILTADHNVRAVFVNIFGGILRCDILAEGLVAAVKELNVTLPIVIRMEGTNVDVGKRMLRESGLNFTTAEAVDEAAAAVVKLAGGR